MTTRVIRSHVTAQPDAPRKGIIRRSCRIALEVIIALVVGAIFFFIMWGNLLLTDRFGARDLSFDPEDEVVRRYQNIVRPYAKRIYAAIGHYPGR